MGVCASYTSIFGLTDDAHLVGDQYSWLGSILYLAQLIMQPVAAFLLVKFPNGKVISSAILLWGSSLAIMSACTNFHSLLGMRFVLGCFEAMIAPCCVAFTQTWWRRGEQTLRNSYWNSMNGVTLIIGSLFTYGLGHIISEKLFRYQIVGRLVFLAHGSWPVVRWVRLALEATIFSCGGSLRVVLILNVDLPILWAPYCGVFIHRVLADPRLTYGSQIPI